MGDEQLRIVHVICTSAFAGAERAVTISARALAERGHHVRVIGGDPVAMTRELETHGVAHLATNGVLDAARAIRRARPFDVVHAHMTAAEAAVLLSGAHRGAGFVVTRHFAQARGSSGFGRVVRVAMRRCAHHEIAISAFVANAIDEASTIVPFGLTARPRLGHGARAVVVVQRLEPEKDTATALHAWARCGLAAEGWRLVLAGDGSERAMLEALARTLGVDRSVTFLGRVADVDSIRSKGSVQLTTARHEHFGLSVLEAMAVGLPVVATDAGAHRELLGELGRYFPAGDVDACARALRDAATDDDWRASTGAALQARQRTSFSLAEHGRRTEQIYLAARAGGAHARG